MTPNQHFPTLVREGLPQLVRRVRRQPRELLWRRLLIDSAWMNPAASKHRALIVDSLLALFEADNDAPRHQEFGRMFKTWRWIDAERVADSVAKHESSLPSLEAEFLSSIAEEVDNRRACLSRARAALDRIPSETNPGEELGALQGSILVRQDADEFARRFPTILEAINCGPFAGKHLCGWLLFRRRRQATETLLRSALEATPSQNRSHDDEVELAAFDGLAALKRHDLVAVGVALQRMHEFALGAWFPGRNILSLVRPLLRKRLLLPECKALLEATAPKRHAEVLLPALKLARRLT